jgi:roadblock/LC7 domain-containing protein
MKRGAANFSDTLIPIDYSILKIEAVDFSETSGAIFSPILMIKVTGPSYILLIIKLQGITYQDILSRQQYPSKRR